MPETNHPSHRADRVKEITDRPEQGITELFNSESYRKWLNTIAAGYSTRQKQFGRQVKKGEISEVQKIKTLIHE